MSIFNELSYVKWLEERISEGGKKGERGRVATLAGCQPSYLSLVLSHQAHFSLEQAERLGTAWRLNEEEKIYFLTMVSFARAASPSLKALLERQLLELRRAQTDLSKRLKVSETLADEFAEVYYSHWLYMAVHLTISIPDCQHAGDIANRLQVDLGQVISILEFLESAHLAQKRESDGKVRWRSTGRQFHLPRTSAWVSQHHGNWKWKALENSFRRRKTDVHYTSVSTLSKSDVEKLRQRILEWIEDSRSLVRDSPEEEIISFCVDFFVL